MTTYDTLIETHLSTQKPIISAAYAGTVGVPVLFQKDYFAPLQKWLDEQNKGQPVGW